SLGCNPHITIAAVAERNCALLIRERGWRIDYGFTPPPAPSPITRVPVGIKLTELLEGFFSTKVTDDYATAGRQGEVDGSSFRFVVTMESDNVTELLNNPQHSAQLTGTIIAPAISSETLTSTDGEISLFVKDPDRPETKLMVYRMTFTSEEGKRYFFDG